MKVRYLDSNVTEKDIYLYQREGVHEKCEKGVVKRNRCQIRRLPIRGRKEWWGLETGPHTHVAQCKGEKVLRQD